MQLSSPGIPASSSYARARALAALLLREGLIAPPP